MLITELKSKEIIASLAEGKVFMINCHGCKEVRFPEKEALELQKELQAEGKLTGVITTDYICNPDNMKLRLEKYKEQIGEADVVLVLSCGVGVQTIAEYLEDKKVCAACDLNLTGGICPITACSKSLVNGQCGGSKDGKCEVDGNMECGWERIYRRLAQLGRLDVLKCPTQVRNFATDDEVAK